MTNIAASLDPDLAELLAVEFGANVKFNEPVNLEKQLIDTVVEEADDPASLEIRPPIVTFLGHVDHGKTSLLDRIPRHQCRCEGKGGHYPAHPRLPRREGRPLDRLRRYAGP